MGTAVESVLEGAFFVIVLSWIGEIVSFFLCWRLVLWGMRWLKQHYLPSMWSDVAVNLVLAILLLIVLASVHQLWWLVIFMGGFVGAFSAQTNR